MSKKNLVEWLYSHYILTLLIVFTGLALFVAITLKTFFDPVDIPTGTAAALATVYAIVPLVLGIFKWRVDKQNKGE